jgi:5-methyltetrahydrofolate--homocysteine methyltransferase
MSHPLQDLLNEKGVLLADGATGTNLFAEGLEAGEAPEVWNFEHPDKIAAHHRLKLHKLQDKVFEVNEAAAKIARAVADKADHKVIVAGSVGPTGELFEPLGALTHADAVDAFREQIRGLKAGGIDVVWIETMSAAEEMQTASEAAIAENMPFVFTGSFDTAGKTMMGLHPRDIHKVSEPLSEKPFAVGANCGVGASDILASMLEMTDAQPDANVIVKGNCGIPEFRGSEIFYSGTPELMSEYARLAIDGGARIIGGCCGTSYNHLAAMRHAIDTHHKRSRPTIAEVVEKIGPMRNKVAAEQGSEVRRERKGRRG